MNCSHSLFDDIAADRKQIFVCLSSFYQFYPMTKSHLSTVLCALSRFFPVYLIVYLNNTVAMILACQSENDDG
ncbi:hypothetical protein [Moraxella marmotae]|uniref:hypothetical protein n=1 Tax=Moraxella marmotae TaxID=3344520 RepID=UPI0035F4CD21